MDLKEAGSSLDGLISSFNTRIVELQELVIARNIYPATSMSDLSAVDTTLKTMESQIQAIKDRLQEERNAIPKAKKLIELSQRQQRKLQHMLAHMPSGMYESIGHSDQTHSSLIPDALGSDFLYVHSKVKEEPAVVPKEKKGRSPAPRWYIIAEELDSLSSYMRGRLTLDKVNIAINEIATYADANAQLIACPKKKLAEDTWERALELRDIAMAEAVKGKYFFLETDIKGPGLKLDNTGKAILTVLRHLGRIQEARIGHHRVFTLSKRQ
ncbi:spindle and kinetochore-associated protein 1 homolog [Phoenix dactylifera]|uniref:SKA complex subunit 1 homolog n=1 Tax=Phoenix dactylifera TaxID=42345 RepID=A0A8B7BWU3_PHODC|nr:spindle and kinetochore-associated protein 1 homolog [Phoenix dactylifera]